MFNIISRNIYDHEMTDFASSSIAPRWRIKIFDIENKLNVTLYELNHVILIFNTLVIKRV